VIKDDGSIILTYGGANTRHDDRRYIQRSIGIAFSDGPTFSKLESDHRGGWISINNKYLKNVTALSLVSNQKTVHQLSLEQGGVRLAPDKTKKYLSQLKWNTEFKTYRLRKDKLESDSVIIRFLDRSVLYGIQSHYK